MQCCCGIRRFSVVIYCAECYKFNEINERPIFNNIDREAMKSGFILNIYTQIRVYNEAVLINLKIKDPFSK